MMIPNKLSDWHLILMFKSRRKKDVGIPVKLCCALEFAKFISTLYVFHLSSLYSFLFIIVINHRIKQHYYCKSSYRDRSHFPSAVSLKRWKLYSNVVIGEIVIVDIPTHDLFSNGNLLCRVWVLERCDTIGGFSSF